MNTSNMKANVSVKKKKLIIVKRPKCCICLEKVGKARTKLECGHSFCTKCILGWVLTDHNTCPMCRACIDMPENLSTRSVLEKKVDELEARIRIMNNMYSERLSALGNAANLLNGIGQLSWQRQQILHAFLPELFQ